MTERDIFIAALQKVDPAERQAYLDDACDQRPELRSQVEDLLRLYENAGSFLQEPAAQSAATGAFPATAEPAASTEIPGAMIGPYKLLERIGEGGMGDVWMAQQSEPVKRLVAVKLIKPGMDSKQVVARFEAERQALALMDHPNIAKVHDAGTTQSDRPYFVMELVKGVPITKYCDEHHLTPRQRLELFVPICHAIQHAHQKGIIHRDLKPSNVLVAQYDGRPVPKVIDFGVAKAAGQALTDKTLVTGFGAIVGTLEYMSPEQAEVNQLDIDTRSDIYSLGVLLYELLTGSTPFTKKDLEKAGMLEMLRVIREQEPSKPSTKLSTAEGLPTLAANRGTEPAKLTKLVRGELDWIVMKAIEKDRSRRYETANGFAMDVQRYLADEQVLACPPSAWYRLRKFSRRNKAALAVASIAGLGVAVTLIVLAISNVRIARETTEKDKARAESMESLKDALAAVDRMLTRVGQDRLANAPGMEGVRKELLEDAVEFYQKFLERSGNDPLIQREVALAHCRLADLLRCLGRFGEAAQRFRKALAMCEALPTEPPLPPEVRDAFVASRLHYAHALVMLGDQQGSEEQLGLAVGLAEALAGDYPDNPAYTDRLAHAFHELAQHLNSRRPEEAEKFYQKALARALNGQLRAVICTNLGGLLVRLGRPKDADPLLRQSLAEWEQVIARQPDSFFPRFRQGCAHLEMANLRMSEGNFPEAEQAAGNAVAVIGRLTNDYPTFFEPRWVLANAHLVHGNAHRQLGQTTEATAAYRRALDGFAAGADDFRDIPAFRQSALEQRWALGQFLIENGQPAGALDVYRQGMSKQTAAELALDRRASYSFMLQSAGDSLKTANQFALAEEAYRLALPMAERLVKDNPESPTYRAHLGWTCQGVADVLRPQPNRRAEAMNFRKRHLAVFRELTADFPDDPTWHEHLAHALRLHSGHSWEMGSQDESSDYFREAIQVLERAAAKFPAAEKLRSLLAETQAGLANQLNILAWRRVARPKAEDRDPSGAVAFAKEALELNPKDGYTWNTLGVAYYRVGQWHDAIAALERSMELRKGGDSFDWFFLALIHWQVGNKEEARKWFDQATQWMQKHQPKNEELRRFRTEAEELLKIEKKQ